MRFVNRDAHLPKARVPCYRDYIRWMDRATLLETLDYSVYGSNRFDVALWCDASSNRGRELRRDSLTVAVHLRPMKLLRAVVGVKAPGIPSVVFDDQCCPQATRSPTAGNLHWRRV